MQISNKVMSRLTRYRALLTDYFPKDKKHVFSHDLAAMMGLSASQIRRDLMCIGYFGVPRYGYEIAELVKHINDVLDASKVHHVAVVGAGNLGRALMTFLESRRATLKIVAAFDEDPAKANRVYNGVPCYLMDQAEEVVKREEIRIVILCVPGPVAQRVTDRLVKVGVKGILNFAPVPIRIPVGVALEEIDLTSALERVAFFTNNRANAPKEKRYADR
ncbi:MAG TPA: redox-sensing transcriptional repressor Rex [Holophaga sp.]|nr:redox-sensing transcriptional repressor Rex [Holophaga sp.]HPS67493.1 redox-sensing transcriptional repressor Rex [Holophaga sp.]